MMSLLSLLLLLFPRCFCRQRGRGQTQSCVSQTSVVLTTQRFQLVQFTTHKQMILHDLRDVANLRDFELRT